MMRGTLIMGDGGGLWEGAKGMDPRVEINPTLGFKLLSMAILKL